LGTGDFASQFLLNAFRRPLGMAQGQAGAARLTGGAQ
jgi:hypothetical protein